MDAPGPSQLQRAERWKKGLSVRGLISAFAWVREHIAKRRARRCPGVDVIERAKGKD
jgi:hypothetical protein